MATEIYLGNPPENIKKWIKEEAERKYQEMLKTPLTFTAEEPNAKLSFNKKDYAEYNNQIVISTNKQNWSLYEYGTEITLVNVGDKVYFRATDYVENQSFEGYIFIINNGKITASGNLNTLLKADGSVLDLTGRDNCFRNIFKDCSALAQAPELPATKLSVSCYDSMFNGCSSLIKAPKLPATELAEYCYAGMFYKCSSLTQAPSILPATKLFEGCYYTMFNDCAFLVEAPILPATELPEDCYYLMFTGCKTLSKASFPNLTHDELFDIVNVQFAFYNAADIIEIKCKDMVVILDSTTA